MNCPLCLKPCQPSVFKNNEEEAYNCLVNNGSQLDHYFYYNHNNIFNIKLIKYNQDVISIKHHTFLDQAQNFWWTVRLHDTPVDQIIGSGSNQLSPTQALTILNRYKKLLIFS